MRELWIYSRHPFFGVEINLLIEEIQENFDLSRRKTLYGLRSGGKEWSICDSSGMCWYSIRLPIFEEKVFLHDSGMVILEDRVIGIFSVHVDVDVEG